MIEKENVRHIILSPFTVLATRTNSHLESKGLVEDWVECFPVDFSLEFLLLVGQQVDLDVGVGGATHVQGRQLLSLNHRHCQTVGVKVVFQLQNIKQSLNKRNCNCNTVIIYSKHRFNT